MALIEWSEELSVNVKIFDDQHKELITIINKLYDAMKIGQGKNIIAEILDELANYTIYHFKVEEEQFDKFQYPGVKQHKDKHKILIDRVKNLQKELAEGKILVSIHTMNLLNDWIINHIQGDDKKYSNFFKDKSMD